MTDTLTIALKIFEKLEDTNLERCIATQACGIIRELVNATKGSKATIHEAQLATIMFLGTVAQLAALDQSGLVLSWKSESLQTMMLPLQMLVLHLAASRLRKATCLCETQLLIAPRARVVDFQCCRISIIVPTVFFV